MKLLFTFFCLTFFAISPAQQITGNWEGMIEVQGSQLPIIFHISKDSAGKLQATFDSPKQKAFNLACGDVTLKADSVLIMIPMIKGSYTGKLEQDNKRITGTWNQGPASLPLDLKKTTDVATVKIINRPQTPKPPFPYKSEDVEYSNADRSIRFGATFTVPLPDPNVNYFRAPVYPTVILITGSGRQDRDETIMDHKPFAVVADHLTRQGIAVLRVDDRDIGKTTGNYASATSADFAKDIEAGMAYLKSREDVDTANIGLVGHSEGGMIAPMVAAKTSEVKFIVLLAGPGEKISSLMEQQAVDINVASGISQAYAEQYRLLYRKLVAAIIKEPDTAKAMVSGINVFNNWQKNKNMAMVKATTSVTDESSKLGFVQAFVAQFNMPWLRYFFQYDPAVALAKVKCPVLAINGEKDIQVAAKSNLAAIQQVLEKAGNKNVTTVAMPGLNHLFQHCTTCDVDEYGELEETFDKATLQLISDWIKTGRFK